MTRSPVSEAIRTLRSALGETQQQFAGRMGTAITTIARYETSRPPKGKALVQLLQIAEEHGLRKEADVFQTALSDDLGKVPIGIGISPVVNFRDDEEKRWVAALLHCLRTPELAKYADAAKKALRRADEQVQSKTAMSEGLFVHLMSLLRLASEGKTAAEISSVLGWDLALVEGILQFPEIKAGSKYAGLYLAAIASAPILMQKQEDVQKAFEQSISELRAREAVEAWNALRELAQRLATSFPKENK